MSTGNQMSPEREFYAELRLLEWWEYFRIRCLPLDVMIIQLQIGATVSAATPVAFQLFRVNKQRRNCQ